MLKMRHDKTHCLKRLSAVWLNKVCNPVLTNWCILWAVEPPSIWSSSGQNNIWIKWENKRKAQNSEREEQRCCSDSDGESSLPCYIQMWAREHTLVRETEWQSNKDSLTICSLYGQSHISLVLISLCSFPSLLLWQTFFMFWQSALTRTQFDAPICLNSSTFRGQQQSFLGYSESWSLTRDLFSRVSPDRSLNHSPCRCGATRKG